jgi:ketosteroid isomerase-like protein
MSHENVDIVRRAYVALNERDLDSLARLNHPDAILDFSRSIGPQKGVYRGWPGIPRCHIGVLGRLPDARREALEAVRLREPPFPEQNG